jgi:hypothetical protein
VCTASGVLTTDTAAYTIDATGTYVVSSRGTGKASPVRLRMPRAGGRPSIVPPSLGTSGDSVTTVPRDRFSIGPRHFTLRGDTLIESRQRGGLMLEQRRLILPAR